MPAREDLGKLLLDCLKEVGSLLEHAHNVALKQQDALVKNDAEAIVLTARAQEEVLRRISESDQRAAVLATELAEAAGLDGETASAAAIAEAAGYPYTKLIQREMGRISDLSETVRQENSVCSSLLKNGLDIIANCLRTIASDPGPSAYNRTASIPEPQAFVLSLDRKA